MKNKKNMVKKIISICFLLPIVYCKEDTFDFSIKPLNNGFYYLQGYQFYIDDFSQTDKACYVEERSGAKFFKNCNNDCCWYIDINSADVKMGHNGRMIDLKCKELYPGTTIIYNCRI